MQYAFRKIQYGESETVDLRPSYLCANLLGRYAKSLKTKFTGAQLRDWAALTNADAPKQIAHIQKLLASLSPFHRVILQYYVDIWNTVVEHADKNRMTARNIANVMAPNFIEDSLAVDLSAINSAVSLIQALVAHRLALFTEAIAGQLSSADDAWENFSPDVSDGIESAFQVRRTLCHGSRMQACVCGYRCMCCISMHMRLFARAACMSSDTAQQGNTAHVIKINGADYEVQMQMLLQMKVTDRNRQRPVRRRVLHHDQTTFNTLQVVDESPERPDGTASLRTVFDVFSLLPKTVKSPHYAAPTFPGTDCIICPWPVPNGYRLEQLLGPVFIQAALSHIRQHYLCGPAAYQCWLLPSTSSVVVCSAPDLTAAHSLPAAVSVRALCALRRRRGLVRL